jgi:hypothetical protein
LELDYEKDVSIDPNALDVEILDQARWMLRYCKHAENAKKEMDWAKERLDVKRAELDKDVRTNPDKYDIGKITESAINNAIVLHPDYQALSSAYIEAKYEAGMASAAVRAFDQRKTALENLVKLHAAQYFAGPRVPRNLAEEHEKRQERSNDRVGRAMQRRRLARTAEEE